MIKTQFINLFKENKDVIDKHSSAFLNSLRDEALASFEKLGLPTKKEEDYLYIDIAKAFDKDLSFNLTRETFKGNPYDDFICNVPSLSNNLYFMLNDSFYNQSLPKADYPKGVFVGSLDKFAKEYPTVLEKYYGKIAGVDKSGLIALNTMFAQDGFVVYVPKGVVVEEPIQIINLLKSEEKNYLANRRVLIVAEDNAQVKVLACDHTLDDKEFVINQVTEVYAGQDAVVDFYELEENSTKVIRVSSTQVQQGTNSDVLVNNITLNSGMTRNNYDVKLMGEHAEAYVCGLVIADKKQYVDNFAFLDHLVPNCQSTQLFKYVLEDEAIGSFCGRIRVEKDAQKTLAYQTNNNLCVSPQSRMYSKPQLEIYADDVKCSHGLTTGQIDEDALFYLRARGIEENEARLLLMQAFTGDVLNHIRIDDLRTRLEELVEKRFKGETATCGNCAVCK